MSKQHILSAVNFLREHLHEVFVAGVHATASAPVAITKKEKPFIERMQEIKLSLMEGDDLRHSQDGTPNTNRLDTANILLDNAIRSMESTNQVNTIHNRTSNGARNVAPMDEMTLTVTRKIIPQLIAFEIIGVQPMTGPVDQVNTLRVKYVEPIVPTNNPLSPFDIETYKTGQPILEGKAGANRLSIQIMREVVESKTRKLAARWTFARIDESKDVEDEIMAALAQEVTAEIDQEMLTYLKALPGNPTSTYDMLKIGGEHTFVGDIHAALAILINRQANLIAARTRRGAGNWCVVSPTALTILQSATTSAFARASGGAAFESMNNTKFVGTLNDSMKVYVDQYAAANTPVLVGYKGNEFDAAAFYAPYVLLNSSGVIVDPNTFEPVVSFMTRYGFLTLTNAASSLGNAADYLGLVGIETNSLSFI